MIKKITRKKVDEEAVATCVAYIAEEILNDEGELASLKLHYAECLGTPASVRSIVEGFKSSPTTMSVEAREECRVSFKRGYGEVQRLPKNMSLGQYAAESVSGKRFNVLFGEDESGIRVGFLKWLRDVNILPYPAGKINDDGEVFEYLLFDHMIESGLLYQLKCSEGLLAYRFKRGLSDGSEEMRQAIMQTIADANGLGISKLRKRLADHAPEIGSFDTDAFEVFACFSHQDGKEYRPIQYDKDSDDFLALVTHPDGSFEWGQFNLQQTFENAAIGIKPVNKEFVNMEGEITNAKEAV